MNNREGWAQRQELIEWAKGYISAAETYVANNPADRSGKAYLELLQIALAALTAEPAGKFYAGPRGKVSIHPSEALPLGFNPFYTTPSAPVLRVPDGWKLVPVEPTEDMLAAAKEWFGLTTTAEGVYEKMLAAAPEAQQ